MGINVPIIKWRRYELKTIDWIGLLRIPIATCNFEQGIDVQIEILPNSGNRSFIKFAPPNFPNNLLRHLPFPKDLDRYL